MLSVHLAPEIEARLQRIARKTGRTKTFLAREAIAERITEFEKIYMPRPRAKTPRKTRLARK